MERMFRHGRGLVEMSTKNDSCASSKGANSNRVTGIGHGYGPVKLEKAGTNITARFASSSPAFEVNNSLGYAFGHGRCFYRRPEPYVDQFLFFQIDMIDSDSDDDEDTSSSSSSTNVSSESDDDDEDEQDGDSLSSSSRPDSGIGL